MAHYAIIGAGPIGSYTAIKLALCGHKVTVLDKKKSADQDICCTGIISQPCYELLKPYVSDKVVFRSASKAAFIAPSSYKIDFARTETVTYILNRPLLNKILAEAAQSLGVEYIFETYTADIYPTTSGVDISVRNSSKESRLNFDASIIATGLNKRLCTQLGLGTITEYAVGAQTHVSLMQNQEIEVYLDHKLAPGGFAWLVPTTNGSALAGLLTKRNPVHNLSRFIEKLIADNKIARIYNNISFGLIPQKSLGTTYTNRAIVVGSAAGQVKPITGGGIYFGLLCADTAVDTLNKAAIMNDFSSAFLSNYQKTWHKILLREINTSYFVQKLWSFINNDQIDFLVKIIMGNRNVENLINTGNNFKFDYHSRLLFDIVLSLLPFASQK